MYILLIIYGINRLFSCIRIDYLIKRSKQEFKEPLYVHFNEILYEFIKKSAFFPSDTISVNIFNVSAYVVKYSSFNISREA